MTPVEAFEHLRLRDTQVEALRSATEAEALPIIRSAWDASPGKIEEGQLLCAFLRVGLVEQREDKRGSFDFVWLERAAYRLSADAPSLLLESRVRVDHRWTWQLCADRNPVDAVLSSEEAPGVVWLRERGRYHSTLGYFVPWVYTDGPVEQAQAHCEVDRLVHPAAQAWLAAAVAPVAFVDVDLPLRCAPSTDRFADRNQRDLARIVNDALDSLDADSAAAYNAYTSCEIMVRCRIYADGRIDVTPATEPSTT